MSSSIYKLAASVIRRSDAKRGSIKSLVFNSTCVQKKKVYALVCETLKNRNLLQAVLDDSKLSSMEPKLAPSLALVLLYDFLLGKGICCGGPLKRMIHKHKTTLKEIYLEISSKEISAPVAPASTLPRYVRVNSLKMSDTDAIERFTQLGYTYREHSDKPKRKQKCDGTPLTFHSDTDLPNVLVFPSNTDITRTDLYTEGAVILQDKASCIPAHVLDPPPGSSVIDACAAPGNKTTHLSAIMRDKGQIFAFDRDAKRLEVLKNMVHKSGATCAKVQLADFLKVNPMDYNSVEYILLDPSCSGSGITNRGDHLTTHTTQDSLQKRLRSLSAFQYKILCHALKFPSVRRLVYSTCSIYPEENELVIQAVLQKNKDFKLASFMPQWKERGLPIFTEAKLCLRATPEINHTSGFFVAKIERIKSVT